MRFRPARILAVLLACVPLGGCATAVIHDSLTTRLSGDDANAQIEFMHELALRPLASNDEAFNALLLFQDGTAPATYAARVQTLKTKKLLPTSFDEPAGHAVRRGAVAVILCHALHVRGGVTMMVFGVHERYATRELIDLGVFPISSPDQTFSGTELVGILGKAEDFQRGGAGDKTPGGVAGEAK